MKLDEKFLPLDYTQALNQKFHQLHLQSDQSVTDYMEHFYKLLSCVNLHESNDQLVARYVRGLKYSLQGEHMIHSLHSLKEAYQMALKAEEKLKQSSYPMGESFKTTREKTKKGDSGSFDHPNP